MYIAFLIATVSLLIPTLLPMLRHEAWWVRCFDFPRLQLCCLLLVLLLFELLALDLREPLSIVLPAVAFACLGYQVRVHFIHPEPPSPQYKKDSSERDAELVVVAKSVAKTDTPTIVTGDLNDVAWSTTTRLFRKISGLLDPRVGRGMFNTFHADYWFLRWPLDHLFHSSHFTVSEIHRLTGFSSDHFPLLAELLLETGMRDQQKGLTGDREDFQMAEEKARKEDVSERNVPEPDKKNQ